MGRGGQMLDNVKKDYILRLLEDGKRSDGRERDEFRDIKIERGLIGTAEGSAKVTLGDTTVLVGIKIIPGEPYPDSPGFGVMSVNIELSPLASAYFDPGPPSPNAIETARVVDRGIRESRTIDLSKLCISRGKKVWVM